jgi:hypothetical protein
MTVKTSSAAALKIAGRGKPVFPCKPDKAPHYERNVLEHGCLDATTDPRKITAWWNKWPDANIGIPTGKVSGLLIVDIDTYKPGAMTRAELEEKFGPIPDTPTVQTGSGGIQLYFLYPEGEKIPNSAGMLGPHVDVRGEGGYTLAPPSITTGRYKWINKAPPAPVPPKLLQALRDKDEPRSPSGPGRSRRSQRDTTPDNGGPIPDGARDETLTRIAGRLHDGTRDLPQLEDDLHTVNNARCIPPLPPEQVRKIAHSIYRYEPCRPPHRDPHAETVAALAEIEQDLLGREWRGQEGKTNYSIAVAALKLARKYGTLVEDGVRVEVSARQLALAAAVSRRTIANKIKSMGDILRPDNENIAPGKSGAIVLLLPRATLHHSTHRVSSRGGCAKSRVPLTAPRLRWSSPARKPRRGVTPGTSRVRDGIISKKRDAVIRLGKSCERVMDSLEAAGGSMTLSSLAEALDVKRTRELTRRKNPETGKGRDGVVTRLQDVGVLRVDGNTVSLADDWLEALDRERERAGEIALYRRDMARYNRERAGYRNRHQNKPERAATHEEMRERCEAAPRRRREAIELALRSLFAKRPEFRGRRPGQIACMLPWYLPADFPRGPDGAPKDAEVEALLDGQVA